MEDIDKLLMAALKQRYNTKIIFRSDDIGCAMNFIQGAFRSLGIPKGRVKVDWAASAFDLKNFHGAIVEIIVREEE